MPDATMTNFLFEASVHRTVAEEALNEKLARWAFITGAQECREMLARFVEQGGDWRTAASIRANWDPSWGPDPGKPE